MSRLLQGLSVCDDQTLDPPTAGIMRDALSHIRRNCPSRRDCGRRMYRRGVKELLGNEDFESMRFALPSKLRLSIITFLVPDHAYRPAGEYLGGLL
jgi:hypothetical protein